MPFRSAVAKVDDQEKEVLMPQNSMRGEAVIESLTRGRVLLKRRLGEQKGTDDVQKC